MRRFGQEPGPARSRAIEGGAAVLVVLAVLVVAWLTGTVNPP